MGTCREGGFSPTGRGSRAVVGCVLAEAELLYQILKEGGVPLLTIEPAGVDLGDVREEIGFELAIPPDEIPKGVQQLSIAEPSQGRERGGHGLSFRGRGMRRKA